jgi:hypothetical protein
LPQTSWSSDWRKFHLRQGNEGEGEGEGIADPDDKGKAPAEDPDESGECDNDGR